MRTRMLGVIFFALLLANEGCGFVANRGHRGEIANKDIELTTAGSVLEGPVFRRNLSLLSAATSRVTTASSRKNRINSLLQWATDAANVQSASSTILELTTDPYSGLGWFAGSSASSQMKDGALLLSVPSSVALTVEVPGEGPDDSRVVSDIVRDRKVFESMPWFVQMGVYLYKLDQVDARRGDLNMSPWLDSLPRQLDTPIHWSKKAAELQELLQYDYLVDAVQRQELSWKSYHEKLGIGGLSWCTFLWGCEMARSRAFSGAYTGSAFNPLIYAFTLLLVTVYVGLNLGTVEQAANGAGVVICASILKDFVLPKLLKKKRYVICPMIDMANHKSTQVSGEVSFEFFGNAYSLAVKDSALAPGEELFISYGTRSNDQLLQYYGFVESDNPHDVYVMPPLRDWDIDALEKACGRTFANGRLQKLDRAGLLGTVLSDVDEDDMSTAANPRGGVVLSRATGMDPAALQALRALVSTDDEWNQAGEAVGNFCEPLSNSNEECAKLAAKCAMELEYQAKATTLEQDQELLKQLATMKSLDASREDTLALEFRIEKKKVLLGAIEML